MWSELIITICLTPLEEHITHWQVGRILPLPECNIFVEFLCNCNSVNSYSYYCYSNSNTTFCVLGPFKFTLINSKFSCPALMCNKPACISISMAATRITINNSRLTLMHQSPVFEGDIIHYVYHMQSPAPTWKDFRNCHIIQWGMCFSKFKACVWWSYFHQSHLSTGLSRWLRGCLHLNADMDVKKKYFINLDESWCSLETD